MLNDPEILIYPAIDELQAAAAERFATLSAEMVAAQGRALVALSGGSLPPGVFRRLCDKPLRGRVPWGQLSVIWADERVVPFTHPESNYQMARTTLLDHVPIPSEQVYPVATYYGPTRAAEVYERQVAALLEAHGGRLGIALLGMGPDGHTASLFPGFPQLDAPPGALALAVTGSPKPPPERVTLTAHALRRADHAIFLVAGADKAPKVREALRGPYDPRATPAQLVRPPQGHVTWMLDAAAASQL
ncbi:MAG: 6-phosphogluconolactonase [Chloroflexales bacterium]|nr:6-phosphogluconolactonase [Chloroflexales bacterium]